MSAPNDWQRLVSVLKKKLDQSTAGAQIPKPYTPESLLYLRCYQAANMASHDFRDDIHDTLEKLAETAQEAIRAVERGNTADECKQVSATLQLYRKVLRKMDEQGLDEPQTLTVTFNNLVRRHNELNPDQSQDNQR